MLPTNTDLLRAWAVHPGPRNRAKLEQRREPRRRTLGTLTRRTLRTLDCLNGEKPPARMQDLSTQNAGPAPFCVRSISVFSVRRLGLPSSMRDDNFGTAEVQILRSAQDD